MKLCSIAAVLVLCASTAQAATFSFAPALFRGENTANLDYRTANLGDQTASEDRRVPISGFQTGLVAQQEDLSFAHTIAGTRPVVGQLQNTAQGFFKDQDFFVNTRVFTSATCLGNPTAGTCPPRIEASSAFRFDFSVDEDVTMQFQGAYDRGRDIRHISDDQTVFSIFNADRNRTVFFSGSSSPNASDNIFNKTSGIFSGELDLEAGINYRVSIFQAATATGGQPGVEVTDTAAFVFGATLSGDPINMNAYRSQLRSEIAALSAVPLPAAGWMLLAAVAGLGAAGRSAQRKNT